MSTTHTPHGTIRLRVANDGVLVPPPRPQTDSRGGLANLTARVSALGGVLTVDHSAGTFTVTAEVPRVAARAESAV